jgi:hypothetical protein
MDQVAHICFGYRHLLILSYTSPDTINMFGQEARPDLVSLALMQGTDILARNLDREMKPAARARSIVNLLNAITFQFNPEHMQVARNAIQEFLQPATQPLPDDTPDICKILCYNYYFDSDQDSLQRAERSLTVGWQTRQGREPGKTSSWTMPWNAW